MEQEGTTILSMYWGGVFMMALCYGTILLILMLVSLWRRRIDLQRQVAALLTERPRVFCKQCRYFMGGDRCAIKVKTTSNWKEVKLAFEDAEVKNRKNDCAHYKRTNLYYKIRGLVETVAQE